MRRLAKSLIGGVVVQIVIVLGVVVAALLLPRNPEGALQTFGEFVYIAFIVSSPGLMLFGPTGTERNPHPHFSDMGLLLGLIVNILIYSLVVYIAMSLWRNAKARSTKPT